MLKLEKEAILRELLNHKGSSRTKTSDAQLRKTRQEVSAELLKEFGL